MSSRSALLLTFVAGCAGQQMQSRAAGYVRLQVQTLSGQSADWQALPPGGALTSGSMFAVSVTVPSPLYVSLWQRGGDGNTAQLYPAMSEVQSRGEIAVPAAPNRATHLPSPGKWFALDENAGEERLYVLASVQKLDAEAARKLVSDRGDPICEKSREPPPEVKERDRGETVVGTLPADGIAILCFPFSHRPR
jgi:hypothetical protein